MPQWSPMTTSILSSASTISATRIAWLVKRYVWNHLHRKDVRSTAWCSVRMASISLSEGTYLALSMFIALQQASSRDDNCTHVYDSRMLKRRDMLERGVLYNFKHSNMPFSSEDQAFFGVVGVQWVQSRTSRLGLVTGGNDGALLILIID